MSSVNSRPSFKVMWAHFKAVHGGGSVKDVGDKIGGQVKVNVDMAAQDPTQGFSNACALRLSYALNYSEKRQIPHSAEWKTVSGADRRW